MVRHKPGMRRCKIKVFKRAAIHDWRAVVALLGDKITPLAKGECSRTCSESKGLQPIAVTHDIRAPHPAWSTESPQRQQEKPGLVYLICVEVNVVPRASREVVVVESSNFVPGVKLCTQEERLFV